jgi:hypothetical protein
MTTPARTARRHSPRPSESRADHRKRIMGGGHQGAPLSSLSTKSGIVEFSSLFWPGAKRYFDALAQPAAGALCARTCTRARRGRSGERGPLLPALRQITVSRALGGDLRLLYPAFRSTPTAESGSIAKARQSTPTRISCGHSTNGAMRFLRARSKYDVCLRWILLHCASPLWCSFSANRLA